MRTKLGREGLAREQQQKECKAKAAATGVNLSGFVGKLRLDGMPDGRTKKGKEYYRAMETIRLSASSSKIIGSSSVGSSSGLSFVARKDG